MGRWLADGLPLSMGLECGWGVFGVSLVLGRAKKARQTVGGWWRNVGDEERRILTEEAKAARLGVVAGVEESEEEERCWISSR